MIKEIPRPIYKNLKIPESGGNFILYLINCALNVTNLIDFFHNDTINNVYIINKLDDDIDTRNKISFIPLDLLYSYYENNAVQINREYIDSLSKVELKQHLYDFFIETCYDTEAYINNTKYKNVPLYMFKKPYTSVELSKTMDASLFPLKDDINLHSDTLVGFNKIKKKNSFEVNDREWLSINEIKNVVYPYTLVCNNFIYCDVIIFPRYEYSNRDLHTYFHNTTGRRFMEQYKFFINSDKRFFVATILYNSHFTSILVDKNPIYSKTSNKVVVWFFDSCGYDPTLIKFNKLYYFMGIDMKIYKHNYNNFHSKQETNSRYTYVDILIESISTITDVNFVVMNNYECQYDNAECGMYSILFHIFCFNCVDTIDSKSFMQFKKLYYTMAFYGDLLLSSLRGVIFCTPQDCKYSYYKKYTGVDKIKNKKYKEIIHMTNKAIVSINKLNNKLSEFYIKRS